MQFIMALTAEYHGFPTTFDHVALPDSLAVQTYEFTDVMALDRSLLCPAPLACLCKQASSQFCTAFVLLGIGDDVRAVPINGVCFELSGRGEQGIFPAFFSFFSYSENELSWPSFQALYHFVQGASSFPRQSHEEASAGQPEDFGRVIFHIVSK